ncbi:MAG: Minf_1886 family protein [Planctomycetota bacterium]
MNDKKSLEEISQQDGRYNPKAVRFVYEGLGYTARKLAAQPGHVTGQTLCEGLKQLALEKWGRLALLVLSSWQVKTTRDLGEIVYLMIHHKWMRAQSTDTIDDFNDLYDFKTVFKDEYAF